MKGQAQGRNDRPEGGEPAAGGEGVKAGGGATSMPRLAFREEGRVGEIGRGREERGSVKQAREEELVERKEKTKKETTRGEEHGYNNGGGRFKGGKKARNVSCHSQGGGGEGRRRGEGNKKREAGGGHWWTYRGLGGRGKSQNYGGGKGFLLVKETVCFRKMAGAVLRRKKRQVWGGGQAKRPQGRNLWVALGVPGLHRSEGGEKKPPWLRGGLQILRSNQKRQGGELIGLRQTVK